MTGADSVVPKSTGSDGRGGLGLGWSLNLSQRSVETETIRGCPLSVHSSPWHLLANWAFRSDDKPLLLPIISAYPTLATRIT